MFHFLLRLSGMLALAFMAPSCGPSNAQKAAEPARVSGHVAESDLITIALTPQAERRLGIAIAPIERRAVAQIRTLGGEVIAAAAGATAVTRYAATSTLTPSQLAAAQIEADAAIARASATAETARTRNTRVAQLFEAQAESARTRDEAAADLQAAEATLRAARAQRALLGQSVSATQAPARVWVRASVYGGDLARLDRRAAASIRAPDGATQRSGAPISAPATASGLSGASFIFYEVDNRDGALRMGDRVTVSVPLQTHENGLAAPWSAILYDINGGEWVYERTTAFTYARRRVQVRAVVDNIAILASGPDAGAQIVTVGAPELFGTEFGVAH